MKRLAAVALTALPLITTASPRTAPPDSVPGSIPVDTIIKTVSMRSTTENTLFKGAIPPSPQAAALARYAEYPVSHTTGLPDITIPLYEIDLGGFKLPVSISYHASGARVDDMPTSVGSGWVLNAGGAVTRTILGKPDMFHAAAGSEDYSYYDKSNIQALIADVSVNGGSLNDMSAIMGDRTECDTESDRYSFNVGSLNGVFRYSWTDGKFILLNHAPVRIEAFLSGQDTEFHIKDGDGINYTFAAAEATGVPDSNVERAFVTAWYLTDIETPYGHIKFNYSESDSYISGNVFGTVATAGMRPELVYGADDDYIEERFKVKQTESQHSFHYGQRILNSVEWNGNKILFTYVDENPGVTMKRLVSMKVTDSAGNTRKTVQFINTDNWPTGNSASGRRLLSEVRDSDSGTYTFTYNKSASLPSLPLGRDAACYSDLWGFMNTSTPGNVFTSAISSWLEDGINDPGCSGHLEGGLTTRDRSPSLNHTKAGVLESVTFPTGAVTTYSYELNSVGSKVYGGLRVASVSTVCDGVEISGAVFSYQGDTALEEPEDLMKYYSYELITGDHIIASNPTRFRTAVSRPVTPVTAHGAPVVYHTFTATFLDNSSETYFYDASELADPRGIKAGTHPSLFDQSIMDFGSRLPLLLTKTVKDSGGAEILKETYTYEKKSVKQFSAGVRTASNYIEYDISSGVSTIAGKNMTVGFEYCESLAYSRACLLKSRTVKDCVTGFLTRTDYTYDETLRNILPKSVSFLGSDDRTIRKEYVYPFERSDAVSAAMTAQYFTDKVLEERTYSGTQVIAFSKTEYALFNGCHYMPVKARSWTAPTVDERPIAPSLPTERERVTGYNSLGRPLAVWVEDSDLTSFTWDSSGEYLLSCTAPGNLTTSYTHRPLFGVASVTLPNGHTTGYAYNAAGMLSSVEDNLGVTATYSYSVANHSVASMTGAGNSVTESIPLDPSGQASVVNRRYHDGLGRPSTVVAGGANTSGKYLYSSVEYDCRGRERRHTLPMAGGAAIEMKTAAEVTGMGPATYGDPFAWSETLHDAIGRPVSVSTPGEAWHDAGKGKTMQYVSNAAGSVRRYSAPMNAITLSEDGYYSAGTLQGVRTIGEDGVEMTVYHDRLGRKVLERRGPESLKENNDTYFVYNDLGQLRYVLSPGYELSGFKEKFAYEYRYDDRGEVVKKFIPGASYTQYWPDRSGWVYLSEDMNLRERNLMRFTLSDAAGRLTLQGVSGVVNRNIEVNRTTFRGTSTGGFAGTGYTIPNSHRLGGVSLELVNYYDDYSFVAGLDPRLASSVSHASAEGLLTGVVEYDSDGGRSMSAVYYDIRGNIIETREVTADGSLRVVTTSYNFSNQPVSSTLTENGVTVTTAHGYHTASGLPVSVSVAVNGVSAEVSKITYDDLGRIGSVRRGGESAAGGSVDYTYNLHGWLESVSGPGFSQTLSYAEGPGAPRYDGKVSAMSWTMGNDPVTRGYRYSYNEYGWLTLADYGEGESLTGNHDRYTERISEFTRNGMPRKIQRHGLKADGHYGKVDNLRMSHDGNRVTGVKEDADAVTQPGSMDFSGTKGEYMEMEYNSFGSLIRDESRGISDIEYDNFGNPVKISYSNGDTTRNVYSASGEKLKSVHATGVEDALNAEEDVLPPDLAADAFVGLQTIEYRGPLVYRDGRLNMVRFAGGYATVAAGGSVTFHYYTCDYLGSNRAVVNGSTGAVEQTVAYYPYGGIIADLGFGLGRQPFKFGGKELISANGLNEYDFGARQYWHAVPGFNRIDPLCEKFYWLSPYLYCGNDPVNAFDPDGRDVFVMSLEDDLHMAMLVQDKEGKWKYYSINGDNKFRIKLPNQEEKYTGGKIFDDLGIGSWDSPEEFLKSEYNKKIDHLGFLDKNHSNYNFTQGYLIKTTSEQDIKIVNKFTKISKETSYNFATNNCATAVQEALIEARIKVSPKTFSKTRPMIPTGVPNFILGVEIEDKTVCPIPSKAFRLIIEANPTGKLIRKNSK